MSLPSVVCRTSTFSNTSYETTGLIEARFYVESPWDGGTNICLTSPGHMTKMTAFPIYGKKNLKNLSSSPQPKGR